MHLSTDDAFLFCLASLFHSSNTDTSSENSGVAANESNKKRTKSQHTVRVNNTFTYNLNKKVYKCETTTKEIMLNDNTI